MKISEFITELERIKSILGDVKVFRKNYNGTFEIIGTYATGKIEVENFTNNLTWYEEVEPYENQ